MDMTNPGVQYPHCVPLLLTSCSCTSFRFAIVPTPSTVVMAQPSHLRRGVVHCEKLVHLHYSKLESSPEVDSYRIHSPSLYFIWEWIHECGSHHARSTACLITHGLCACEFERVAKVTQKARRCWQSCRVNWGEYRNSIVQSVLKQREVSPVRTCPLTSMVMGLLTRKTSLPEELAPAGR